MTTQNTHSFHKSQSGFYRLPQILFYIPISRATWWRWVKEGKAPKGCKLGPKTTAWKAEQIHQLIAELAEEQEG